VSAWLSIDARGYYTCYFLSILTLFLSVFNLTYTGCAGGPLEPESSGWFQVASFIVDGSGPTGIAKGPDNIVYIVGRTGVIFRYDGRNISTDFESPYDDCSLWDIGTYKNVVWVVGSKEVSGTVTDYTGLPYFLYNDGSGWSEIPVDLEGARSFYGVYPVNEKECWIYGSMQYLEDPILLKYTNGDWTLYPEITNVLTAAYRPEDGILYCFEGISDYDEPTPAVLALTDDGGASWIIENINDRSRGFGLKPNYYTRFFALPGLLYFNADVVVNGVAYQGIIKRTGPPGEGKYDVLFYSPLGPHFRDLRGIAFKDVYDGIAVGVETSVLYDAPGWALEDAKGALHNFLYVTAGPEGYWAIAEGDSPGYALMYHP